MSEEPIKNGKPWSVESTFYSFEEADNRRKQKIKEWEDSDTQGMQVKVKRRNSDGKFLVRVRLHADFEPKKEKKNRKNRSRNKKDSN